MQIIISGATRAWLETSDWGNTEDTKVSQSAKTKILAAPQKVRGRGHQCFVGLNAAEIKSLQRKLTGITQFPDAYTARAVRRDAQRIESISASA